LIIRGRIIDGTGSDPIEKGAVVVSSGRILEVGPEKDIEIPKSDTEVINASGKTIIPGLIDAHVHFCLNQGFEPLDSYAIGMSTLYGVENARRWINAGVTTVRDVGCKHRGVYALRQEIDLGRVAGPRMLIAGRIISQSGRTYIEKGGMSVPADGADEVRKIAREELGAGADWVKVYASGQGVGPKPRDPWDVWMTVEEISAACDEAHSKGKKAAAHAINAEAAMNCIKGGIDSIEHGLLLNDDVLEEMKKHNVYYVPTIFTYYIDGELPIERCYKFKPQDAWIQDRLRNKELPFHAHNVKRATEIGAKIVAGTDIPEPIEEGNIIRADAMAQELILMVKYGLTNMHALRTATQTAAEMLGLEQEIGTLEKGKAADLIILNGDPLTNMNVVLPENISLVMKEGRIIQRQ